MSQKTLTLIFLFAFPIFALVVIFASLSMFSNLEPSSDFVYFESQSNYSNARVLDFKDNKVQEVESPFFKNMQSQINDCTKSISYSSFGGNVSSNSSPTLEECKQRIGGPSFYQNNTAPKAKIYLYQSDKKISKEIDLATAQNLVLVPEKQNDKGEILSDGNCNRGGGLFYPGYPNSYTDCRNSVMITKGLQSKSINLETNIVVKGNNFNNYNGYNPSEIRNIYWVKKN
jgi:hypothetical protein